MLGSAGLMLMLRSLYARPRMLICSPVDANSVVQFACAPANLLLPVFLCFSYLSFPSFFVLAFTVILVAEND